MPLGDVPWQSFLLQYNGDYEVPDTLQVLQ